MEKFRELGLDGEILKGIADLGFETPSPVQEKAIPVILGEENDLVVLAQTGTGKTAAFGLPLLQKINPDVIGWIRVNDTNINYPLLQTDDDDTYMNTDAEGKYSLSGAIFLHCGNKPDFSDFNNIIYGHHMEKEKMFGDIGNFTDETYFDEHPYGNLFFDGKDHGIEFYALMQVDAYNETIFNVCPDTSEAKQAYLLEIIDNALYKRELNITEDDHLVLLTTCTSDMTNGRNVLVGRLTDQVYPEKEKAKNLGTGIDQLKDMITNVPVIIWMILIIIVLLLLNRQIGKKGRKKHEKN